jgi:hypothetical protein
MTAKNPHIGSSLDDLLREDEALEHVEARARKHVRCNSSTAARMTQRGAR